MLRQLTPQLACSRACSKPEITLEAFKAALRIRSYCDDPDDATKGDEWKKWFWELFKEFSKEDRMLTLKFMSGNSRLNQGVKYNITI